MQNNFCRSCPHRIHFMLSSYALDNITACDIAGCLRNKNKAQITLRTVIFAINTNPLPNFSSSECAWPKEMWSTSRICNDKVVNMISVFLFQFCRRVSLLLDDDGDDDDDHHHHLQQHHYHQRSGTTCGPFRPHSNRRPFSSEGIRRLCLPRSTSYLVIV